MSLMDALLLESYRDPRDVYIALRSDGVEGSGTIDDPYDGGTRNGTPLVLTSLTFDPVEVMAMAVGTRHNCSQGDKVRLPKCGRADGGTRSGGSVWSGRQVQPDG